MIYWIVGVLLVLATVGVFVGSLLLAIKRHEDAHQRQMLNRIVQASSPTPPRAAGFNSKHVS